MLTLTVKGELGTSIPENLELMYQLSLKIGCHIEATLNDSWYSVIGSRCLEQDSNNRSHIWYRRGKEWIRQDINPLPPL